MILDMIKTKSVSLKNFSAHNCKYPLEIIIKML